MLVISRRKGQRIAIGDEIELVVTELHRSSVKLGIRAPRGYAVLRGEVRDSIEEANRLASETVLDGVEIEISTAAPLVVKAPTDLLRSRQSPGDEKTAAAKSQPDVIIRRRPQPASSPPVPANDTEAAKAQ